MLQFVSIVKKKKNKIFLYILPIITFVCHSLLASLLKVYPNYGVSFGVNLPMQNVLLLILMCILIINLAKNFDVGMYMLLVGALVNFADRLFFAYVRDYFKMLFFYNNLADLLIFAGLIFFGWENFYGKNRHNI